MTQKTNNKLVLNDDDEQKETWNYVSSSEKRSRKSEEITTLKHDFNREQTNINIKYTNLNFYLLPAHEEQEEQF